MGKFHFTFICWGRYFSKKKHNICSQFGLKNNTPIKKNNKCYNYYSFGLKITLLSKKNKKINKCYNYYSFGLKNNIS